MAGKIPSGKTVFIWQLSEIKNTLGLEFSALADVLKEDGVNGVLVKAVEGRILFNHPLLPAF